MIVSDIIIIGYSLISLPVRIRIFIYNNYIDDIKIRTHI